MKTGATPFVRNENLRVTNQKLLKLMAAVFAACLPVLFCAGTLFAQPTDARVTFTASSPGFVTGVFYVALPDSTGYSDVEISLKDNLEDSTVFSRVFVFDETAGLPAGVTWLREGNKVYMGMGTHAESVSWLGKARLKETGGAWSSWYEFRFN